MLKELAALTSFLRNAQEISGKLGTLVDRLKGERIVGKAGAGLVTVEVNGLAETMRVSIDPRLLNPEEKDLLEELLAAAMRDAVQKAKERHLNLLGEITGGIPIPALDELMKQFIGPA